MKAPHLFIELLSPLVFCMCQNIQLPCFGSPCSIPSLGIGNERSKQFLCYALSPELRQYGNPVQLKQAVLWKTMGKPCGDSYSLSGVINCYNVLMTLGNLR